MHPSPDRASTPTPNRDGRVARGERTRRAIVEAHASLVVQGELRPTAKLIAARAGISVRTLWLNFGDMDSLMSATSRYWLDRDVGNWTPVPADLPLRERIDTWCRRRAARMEDLAPAAASGMLVEPFSPALLAARTEHRTRLHRDLVETFGHEIGHATGSRDAAPLHMALFVAANSMTWQVLRRDEGYSLEQATDFMRQAFTRLLQPVPAG